MADIDLVSVQTTTPADLRAAYGHFPSGVAAVCGLHGDEPVGIAASSFTSVSMKPALVSVCIQRTSETWPLLRRIGRLGVSMLAEGQEQLCRDLAAKTGPRFDGLAWQSVDGAVLVPGATAWLVCDLVKELPAGDHRIALLRVRSLATSGLPDPLVFYGSRFRGLR